MTEKKNHCHYVATYDQAKALLEAREQVLVDNCGCRQPSCKRSHKRLCVWFTQEDRGKGSVDPLTQAQAIELLEYAHKQRLVARPFRDFATHTRTNGICFCCDDCCAYFVNPKGEPCDKGESIEQTNLPECTDCGQCEAACYFGARKMVDGKLALDREKCYGCGLCTDVCPTNCITMVQR